MTRKQTSRGYPAVRVFVFGQEVTEDVLSVTVTLNDARAPNTCDIELASKRDKYMVDEVDMARFTTANVAGTVFPDGRPATNMHFDWDARGGSTIELPSLDPITGKPNRLVNVHGTPVSVGTEDDLGAQLRANARVNATDAESVARRLVKERVLKAKTTPDCFQDFSQPDITELTVTDDAVTGRSRMLKGRASRYPLTLGCCIFHTADPVRVFMRDPYDPTVWFHMFAGYVSDWTDSVDENDLRLVRLRCEDVTRILKYARITTQPGVFDIKTIKTHKDFAQRTAFKKVGANLTLPELLFTLIFGPDAAGTASLLGTIGTASSIKIPVEFRGVYGVSRTEVQADAAGAFNFNKSTIVMLGPQSEQESVNAQDVPTKLLRRTVATGSLAAWHGFVDHTVTMDDLMDLSLKSESAVLASLSARHGDKIPPEEIITEIGSRPDLYPVERGRLLMLLPASLGANVNRAFIEKDMVDDFSLSTTWSTRLGIIYDVLERINFSFYATPRGDLVCEMPLYDFEPADFGEVEHLPRAAFKKIEVRQQAGDLDELDPIQERQRIGAIALQLARANNPPKFSRGAYAPGYRFHKEHMIAWERAFVDEKIRTQYTVPRTAIPKYPETSGGGIETLGPMGIVTTTLYALIPAFGARAEESGLAGFITSLQAAKLYGEVQLARLNADAMSAHVRVTARLQVTPNRPLEFAERCFIGTCRQVTHRLVWGEQGELSTEVDVNYVRSWSGQTTKRGTPYYEPIGGFGASPLNYAIRLAMHETPPASTQPGDG